MTIYPINMTTNPKIEDKLRDRLQTLFAPRDPVPLETASTSSTYSIGPSPNDTDGSEQSVPMRRPAPLFTLAQRAPPVPAELSPITLEQQAADIVRVCARIRLDPDAWPSTPTVMPEPSRAACEQWSRLPAATERRVSEWRRLVGWTGARAHDALLLVVIAGLLEGWPCSQRVRYPKAAVPYLRRAAWLLRDVQDGSALLIRIRTALKLPSE